MEIEKKRKEVRESEITSVDKCERVWKEGDS